MNDENSKHVVSILSAEDEQAFGEVVGKLAAFSSGASHACPSCGETVAGVTLYEKIEPELFSLYVEPCGHRLGMWSGAPEWVKEAGLPIRVIPLQDDTGALTVRRQTKLDQLQQLIDSSGRNDVSVEFRPFRGWYLIGEPRWIGDDGADYLGRNFTEARPVLAGML